MRVLAHPTRMRIFAASVEEPFSAKELAERFEQPVGRLSYHVRALADAGLLKPVRRTRRRGAVETHYRAVATPDLGDDVMAEAGAELLGVFAQAMVRDIADDAVESLDQGHAAADDLMFARAHFTVSDAGRERLFAEVLGFYRRLGELEAELRADAEGEDGETHHFNVILGHYAGEQHAERNGPFILTSPLEESDEPRLDRVPPRDAPA
jgi:DNA-binding transcriptional ArsR family regulator